MWDCGRNLRGKVVKLHRGHSGVEAVDDLDGDLGGIDVRCEIKGENVLKKIEHYEKCQRACSQS